METENAQLRIEKDERMQEMECALQEKNEAVKQYNACNGKKKTSMKKSEGVWRPKMQS